MSHSLSHATYVSSFNCDKHCICFDMPSWRCWLCGVPGWSVEPCQRMRPVTLHPYVARRAPAKSVPTVEVDVHVVPGHMHTPCVHGVEGAAAVVAREGGSSAAGHRVLKPLL